ncbi:hypothetical protein JCM11491_005456 [Sporobolomyces phaffii]
MATTTATTSAKLIYSLPTRPPIAFPVHPTYPVRLPTRDLPSAYLESLWTSTQPDQVSLESFARLVLSLRNQTRPVELDALLRSLVRPLHDFDRRWRTVVPDALEDEDDDDEDAPTKGKRDGLGAAERDMFFSAYERWEVDEIKRLEEDKAKRVAKGKERARDQDRMEEDGDDEAPRRDEDEVKSELWVSDREVYETRLQALLLLTLISLPPSTAPPAPQKKGKGRKKKDPERDSKTLDPPLLLDFLTDRLQIWRVMQSLSTQDDAETQDSGKQEIVETRDAVQEWWADIVDPLYRDIVPEDVLAHHRIKLFPDGPTDPRSTSQAALYEERSLMSLDKSARRRDLRESQAIVSESPTMKRLMSLSSLAVDKQRGDEVFKMPLPPTRRNTSTTSTSGPADSTSDSTMLAPEQDSNARSRLPRKQERPRPLPRGDSATANMKDMLKRREVSLSRRASVTGVSKKGKVEADPANKEIGRKRKRKSASPQKLSASSRTTEVLTLVPDTPAKPVAKTASFKKPFSRAISLPSFAALGAAFRPGAPDPASVPLPFGIPPPPILPRDRQNDMEWERSRGCEESDEEDWLVSRKEDFRLKGGRSRNTSGSTEGDDVREEDGGSLMDTPKKNRVVLVADTPN